MLKIENVVLPSAEQMKAVIRGMRNPMNSWEKSDSEFGSEGCDNFFHVGENDFELMKKLNKAGSAHAKYKRMMWVYCDIVAPMYWWSEWDTYLHTIRNSCSKMHKLMEKPFELSDFSFNKLTGYKKDVEYYRPDYDYSDEIWKESYGGYSFSCYGRIKNKKGIIVMGSVHKDHYIFITINGKQYPVHRIIAELFCEKKAGKDVVNHIDGNKMNNASNNLEWVTQSENVIHSYENNLQPLNLSSYKGKFTKEQREKIISIWESGSASKREISKMYGVSHTCICDIINEKYKYAEITNVYKDIAIPLVDKLNELRDCWINTTDAEQKKAIWYSIIQMLPSSYNQRSTVMMNYETLTAMYRWRRTHKLDEWQTFCDWLETLPYAELITGGENE